MIRKLLLLSFLFLSWQIKAQQLNHVLGELIIKLDDQMKDPDFLLKDYKVFNYKTTYLKPQKCISEKMNIWTINFDFTNINEFDFLRAVRRHKYIQYAQFNHIVQRRSIPNDPDFQDQWNFLNTGQTGGLPDADIDLDLAWDITTGGLTPSGDSIVIAILDDGVDTDHIDLVDNLWKNYQEIPNNGIDDDENGYIDDFLGWDIINQSDKVDHDSVINTLTNDLGLFIFPEDIGHGTEVASMAGAVGNNMLGITGVNWNIKLMIISPFGPEDVATTANAIEAYDYVLNMRILYNETKGVKGAYVVVTNASWGVQGFADDAPIWCDFYDVLGEEGILNTVATYNEDLNVEEVGDLPTTCPSVFIIGVTSSDHLDQKAEAGFGEISIDLAAPGENVPVLIKDDFIGSNNGTSFAAPTVAGAVALLYSAPCEQLDVLASNNPTQAAQLIKSYLLNGVDKKPSFDGITVTGGRLNVHNSLRLLLAGCGPCPPISSVSFNDIKLNSIEVNWELDTNVLVSLQYRPIGTENWRHLMGIENTVTLMGLTVCTDYELQLATECGDMVTYGPSYFFKTEGCCEPPTEINDVFIGDEAIMLEWPSVFSATAYEIRCKVQGAAEGKIIIAIENQYNITDLAPCTTYEFQIGALCPSQDSTTFSELFVFKTVGCGACEDLVYCDARAEDSFFEWIHRVELNSLINESNSNNGYGSFTEFTTTLDRGAVYDLTITSGFSDGIFAEYYKAWIDFNQDGAFDDELEVIYDSEVAILEETIEGVIEIPEDAMLGLTRMRITMKTAEDISFIEQTPCEIFDFGEVEDYCVMIAESSGDSTPICNSPNNLQISTVDTTMAAINWMTVEDASEYIYRYKESTATDWIENSINGILDNIILENLTACTLYEIQVATNCVSTNTSNFSPSLEFMTPCSCAIPTDLIITAIDSTTFMIEWETLPSVTNYEVFYSADDASIIRIEETTEGNILLQDIAACIGYDIMVTPICNNKRGDFVDTKINNCSVSITDLPQEIEKIVLHPTPFSTFLILNLSLKDHSQINYSLFDIDGRQIDQPRKLNVFLGENTIRLDYTLLPRGVYLVHLETETGHFVKRIIKM